jgi:hypothetical protein
MEEWVTNGYDKYLKRNKKKHTPETFKKYLDSKVKNEDLQAVIANAFWQIHKIREAIIKLVAAEVSINDYCTENTTNNLFRIVKLEEFSKLVSKKLDLPEKVNKKEKDGGNKIQNTNNRRKHALD